MDGSRFDAWTRRRFGLAVGGLASSLLALDGFKVAAAKKKGKKKRCRKLGQSCTPSGGQKCCKGKGLSCQIFEETLTKRRCCRRGFESCQTDDECCSQDCTDNLCACKSNGTECAADPLCCSLNCEGTCQPG